MKKRIAELANEIIHHKALYYEGRPEISDAEYDKLEQELRKLDPNHKVLSLVGTEPSKDSKNKVSHNQPMLSLAKTYDLQELLTWQKKRPVIGMPKIDGNSLSLVYENGHLTMAKTRGNGFIGEDVSNKITWVTDCPKVLRGDTKNLSNKTLEIRGELYCKDTEFIKLLKRMKELGLPEATSPRNIVAGILGRKQHIHLAQYFNFFAFDVLFLDEEKSPFQTEDEKINWLQAIGFSYPPHALVQTKEEMEAFLAKIKAQLISHEYDMDGAVFSLNDLKLHQSLGATAHHPRYKIAFKWPGETAETTIKDIAWATSRLGIVTPVAKIEPTNLSDATITNVTLHNMAHVKLFNLKKGDRIEIIRSGEVIPKFLRVIKAAPGLAKLPKLCPTCSSPLSEDEVRLYCNNQNCEARILFSILNWIRKVEIDDLSEKRLSALLDSGKVSTIADLYRLTLEDFLELPLTKEKLAKKLYESIQESKKLELVNFLNGLGIAGAGRTTWQALLKAFPSLKKIRAATEKDLIALDGFAEKTAEQIVSGLEENSNLIDELLELGVKPKAPQKNTGKLALDGMTFVITGALSRGRKEIADIIVENGGKVSSSVTSKTTALISSDFSKTSSKISKAKELGTELWSEEKLFKLIEG